MIERLAAGARRLDGNNDVFLDAFLADEVGHALGTHAGVEARVSLKGSAGYDACWRLRHDGFVLRHDTYFLESMRGRYPAARFPLSECGRFYSPRRAPFCAGWLNCWRVARRSASKLALSSAPVFPAA